MICCIGLFVGFLAGEILGVGPILAPIGFMLGLTGDVTIFGFLARGKEIEARQIMVSSCCESLMSRRNEKGKNK